MKTTFLIVCSLLAMSFQTTTTFAGQIVFNDAANVKVARVKSQARVLKNADKDTVLTDDQQELLNNLSGNTSGDCGSINVGNSEIGQKTKKIDVIILGDVINAGNKC